MSKHKIIQVGINIKEWLAPVNKFLHHNNDRYVKEDEENVHNLRYVFTIFGQMCLIAFLNFAEKVITTASYIFPFSYLLRNNKFHHTRKPFMNTWNELIEINRKSKTNFYVKGAYEDQYFYNYIGEFEGKHTKKNIDTYLEMVKDKFKGNAFMQNYSPGLKMIKVVREAASEQEV